MAGGMFRWGQRGTAGAAIPARLTLQGVAKQFGTKPIIHALDLDIEAGEIVCLLGPSGCGKTTLLRLIAGIERPTSGEIKLDGRRVAGADIYVEPEHRGIGLMFQDYALFPHLSVRDNVLFGLTEFPAADAATAAQRALGRVGLEQFADVYPEQLSGGEQQRVALARSLVREPQLLLADEPFGALDALTRIRMHGLLQDLVAAHRPAVLLVTHDVDEAIALADRIVVLDSGRVARIRTVSPDIGSAADAAGHEALRRDLLADLGVVGTTH